MSTVSLTFPVARRAHRCTSCRSLIAAGERYRRWTGTGDMWPGLATAKECAECCERYGRPLPAGHGRHDSAIPVGLTVPVSTDTQDKA